MPGDNEQRSPADITQVLQDALLLSDSAAPPTIFSVNPRVWGSELRVIDIGPLLGVRTAWQDNGSELERTVVLAFQSAGWPVQRVIREFRPNLKSPTLIDVALVNDAGECLVAVEVRRTLDPDSDPIRDPWAQLAGMAPRVQWHCVTDGIKYSLRDNKTGASVELEGAFSPDSLETNDFSTATTAAGEVPTSLSHMRDILKGTERVVLDHTLPLMRLDSGSHIKKVLEQELGRSIPSPTDLTHALLAWLAQLEGLSWLTAYGTANMLRGEASQWLRDDLGKRFSVRAVIEFGAIFQDIHPSVRFCILHLGNTPGHAFLSSDSSDPGRVLSEQVHAARQFFAGETPSRGFIAEVKRAGRWAVSLYDPELDKLEARLAGIGQTKPLSEVCTIVRGFSPVVRARKALNGVPLATRVAHLEPGATLEDLKKVELTPELEKYLLRSGDLVVPAIKGGAKLCTVVQTEAQLVASDRLFIIRITDPTLTPNFLVEYLNSRLARRLIEDRYSGSGLVMLTARSLGSLPVPLLSRPVTLDLREIGTLEAALRRSADELQEQRQTLFDATTAETFASAVQNLRRKGELLSRSLLRAQQLEFQVANFYPFPIAYGYRLLASISNPTDLYKEQLRIGENILAFLASVSMSLIQPSDLRSVGLDVSNVWDSGASPGHWRDIVAKCSKVLSTYKDHPLASSIVGLNISAQKRGFGAEVQKVIGAKNDFQARQRTAHRGGICCSCEGDPRNA